MPERALRPLRGRDPLGLRRALADGLLPALVGAMALLAALALAGAQGAGSLAARWERAVASQVILTLPRPAAGEALAALDAWPGVESARPLPDAELQALLQPWLGELPGLPLPAVIEIALADPSALAPLRDWTSGIAGARLEQRGEAVDQALRLATGVRGLAFALLGIIGLVAAALVAVATRAGIAARRDTIQILHELGARDSDIAGRFARRLALLCALGAGVGTALAVPTLWLLADAALPLIMAREARLDDLPVSLAALPLAAAAIGWATARLTVVLWLQRLP